MKLTQEELQRTFRAMLDEVEVGIHQIGSKVEFFDEWGNTVAECRCGERTAIRCIEESTSALSALHMLVAEGYEVIAVDDDYGPGDDRGNSMFRAD